MAYARMRVLCKDALICDFAEYYHIYDLDSIRIQTAAILACGLPEGSRTIRQLSGQKYTIDVTLLIGIMDTLRNIEYQYVSVHSKKKIQKPKSIFKLLTGQKDEQDIQTFRTPEECEAERERILRKLGHG